MLICVSNDKCGVESTVKEEEDDYPVVVRLVSIAVKNFVQDELVNG